MKACANCGGAMADAANRCPSCGMAVGGTVSDVVAQRDEPVGYGRSPLVLAAIFLLLALLAIAGISWFLN
jgi:uncharacterized membrane protein YvbJ